MTIVSNQNKIHDLITIMDLSTSNDELLNLVSEKVYLLPNNCFEWIDISYMAEKIGKKSSPLVWTTFFKILQKSKNAGTSESFCKILQTLDIYHYKSSVDYIRVLQFISKCPSEKKIDPIIIKKMIGCFDFNNDFEKWFLLFTILNKIDNDYLSPLIEAIVLKIQPMLSLQDLLDIGNYVLTFSSPTHLWNFYDTLIDIRSTKVDDIIFDKRAKDGLLVMYETKFRYVKKDNIVSNSLIKLIYLFDDVLLSDKWYKFIDILNTLPNEFEIPQYNVNNKQIIDISSQLKSDSPEKSWKYLHTLLKKERLIKEIQCTSQTALTIVTNMYNICLETTDANTILCAIELIDSLYTNEHKLVIPFEEKVVTKLKDIFYIYDHTGLKRFNDLLIKITKNSKENGLIILGHQTNTMIELDEEPILPKGSTLYDSKFQNILPENFVMKEVQTPGISSNQQLRPDPIVNVKYIQLSTMS
jgi:hypothetical protein